MVMMMIMMMTVILATFQPAFDDLVNNTAEAHALAKANAAAHCGAALHKHKRTGASVRPWSVLGKIRRSKKRAPCPKVLQDAPPVGDAVGWRHYSAHPTQGVLAPRPRWRARFDKADSVTPSGRIQAAIAPTSVTPNENPPGLCSVRRMQVQMTQLDCGRNGRRTTIGNSTGDDGPPAGAGARCWTHARVFLSPAK